MGVPCRTLAVVRLLFCRDAALEHKYTTRRKIQNVIQYAIENGEKSETGMLARANKSRVSNCCQQCKNTLLTSSLVQNLVVVSHTARAQCRMDMGCGWPPTSTLFPHLSSHQIWSLQLKPYKGRLDPKKIGGRWGPAPLEWAINTL